MKLLSHIMLMLAVVATLVCQSCDDSIADVTAGAVSDSFDLEVSVPLVSSRAVDDGLNEYKVRSLQLYFFRADGHDDAVSPYVHHVVVDGEFDVSRHLRMALPDDALADGGLFGPTAATCYVYAVANVDGSALTATTVDGLRDTAVSSGFDITEPQESFAMDGFATLSLDRSTRIVKGTVSLQRAAAKLTLSVDLPESIDVEQTIVNPFDGTVQTETVTYWSRPDYMHVWIANGVKESRLNAPAVEVSSDALYSNEVYAADGVGSTFTYDATRSKYRYLQNVPFYSYPNRWDPYSPRGNCYLTLEIPWYYTDAAGATQNVVTYYRLSVQPGRNRVERNTHYDMRVTIGRLGGTTVQEPVDMLFDWNYSMQWNVQTLPTDIKEIRYLLLNNNDFSSELDAYAFTLENEERISIPFNTSHPVEIESVEMVWRDYRNDSDRDIRLVASGSGYRYSSVSGYAPASDYAGIEIDASGTSLNFRRSNVHVAWENNRPAIRSGVSSINAYKFVITLKHVDAVPDDPSSYATVIITQIPAIYIYTLKTTSQNYRFVNNNYNPGTTGGWWSQEVYSTEYGFVKTSDVWNSLNNTQKLFWLGSIHGSEYAKNQNTYVLTISKFSAGANYIIADPRSRTVDNLNPSGTAANAVASWSRSDNTNKRLQNYYPADRDASKTRFIAPQIRVASQWGVTYQISRTAAERRCASYQENGRPAGRWRLPTAAEIEYICVLSNQQYIPYLFGSQGETANYWCASGGVDVNNNVDNPSVSVVSTTASERRAVRCVYDEWYWAGDTLTNKNTFRWGDRPRSTTGN